MTSLLVVNPNTSAEMTETIGVTALETGRRLGVEVRVICPDTGPDSIEGSFDEVVSAYWTVDCVLQVPEQFDGVLVACYGSHPAIAALREAIDVPVLGIMEASLLYALPLGAKFSIITTSPRWQPLLEESVRALGHEALCASVRSTGLAVLDLQRLPPEQVRSRLLAEAMLAVERDGAEVIVLGCAGMTGLHTAVSSIGVPVVDPVVAGVALVAALAQTGARTSKHNRFRRVDRRAIEYLPPGIARGYQHARA